MRQPEKKEMRQSVNASTDRLQRVKKFRHRGLESPHLHSQRRLSSEYLAGNPSVFEAWRRGLGDSEYLAARLLQHMTNDYDTMMADAKEYKGILGYGISNRLHRDISYFYRVFPNSVEVFEANFDDSGEPDFKLIKTVDLEAV
jgi:hypothetical protein